MSKVQKHGSSRGSPFRELCADGHFSLKTSSGQSRRSRIRQRRPRDWDRMASTTQAAVDSSCFCASDTVSRGLKTSQVLRRMPAGSRMDLPASFLGTVVSACPDASVLTLLRRRIEGDVSEFQFDKGTKHTSTVCSVSGRSWAFKQCKCPEGRRGTSCWSLCPVARAARSSRDSLIEAEAPAPVPRPRSSIVGRRALSDLPSWIDLEEESCLGGLSSSLREIGEGTP